MSATDDYKIALNVLSRVGINSPDFLKEYSKAKAMLHQMDSYNQIQQQQAQANPMQNQGQTAPMTGQPTQSTTQGDLGANSQGNPNQNQTNQPPMQQEGQGSLNLPQ